MSRLLSVSTIRSALDYPFDPVTRVPVVFFCVYDVTPHVPHAAGKKFTTKYKSSNRSRLVGVYLAIILASLVYPIVVRDQERRPAAPRDSVGPPELVPDLRRAYRFSALNFDPIGPCAHCQVEFRTSTINSMDVSTYPGEGLSLPQLVFALNEELKRMAYSPSYVATNHSLPLKNQMLIPSKLHLGYDLSIGSRRFGCTGNHSRTEEPFCSHNPYPVGRSFPCPHLSLFPEGSIPRYLRVPSLAKNLPSAWGAMVPAAP